MRTAAIISALLHIAIFAIAWIGVLPSERPLIASAPAIEVEIVSDITPKKSKETVKPKPKPAPPPRRAAPPPPPKPKVVKAPDPVAVPEPKIVPPKKKPRPKPKAVEKPKPKPEPPKKVQKPAPRPKSKPKPPPKHDFASVLKTVGKLENKPPPEKKKPKAKKKKDVAPLQQVADLLKKKPTQSRLQRAQSGLSSSELDAVRQHIEPCWNLPAGARDAGSMVVEIRATLNPDGRVRSAVIVNDARARSDVFYRSMAESALRAMLNPRCQPLPLPLDKYSEWRDMVIFFDPQEMF